MAETRTIAGAIKLAYENKTEIDKIKNGGVDGISDKLNDVIEKVDNIGQVKDTDDIQTENASDKDYYINTGNKIVQAIIVGSDEEEEISLASEEETEDIVANANVMNLNNNQVKKTTITMSLNNGGN
jgi:hypothetical protein